MIGKIVFDGLHCAKHDKTRSADQEDTGPLDDEPGWVNSAEPLSAGFGKIMKKRTRLLLVVLLIGAAWFVLATDSRRLAMLPLLIVTLEAPPPTTPADEGPNAEWFDDYFMITRIDDRTISIGEPFGSHINFNYLILGDQRAVLFDSGVGFHDIRPVVDSLTDLPVLAVPSHVHYDHIGSHTLYAELGLIDLPYLRERAPDGDLKLNYGEHLGFAEGVALPTLHVTEWLTPGTTLDLGGRTLQILHTPGHTPDSMALYDVERDQLFIGDFVTEGPTFLFVPGSSVGDELRAAESLLKRVTEQTALLTAHRFDPPGLPTLAHGDLLALRDALAVLRDGDLELDPNTAWWPRSYPINERISLLTDFEWAQRWDD